MTLPSKVDKIPLLVGYLGPGYTEPKLIIGPNQFYKTAADIPAGEVGNGMFHFDEQGNLWTRENNLWVDKWAWLIGQASGGGIVLDTEVIDGSANGVTGDGIHTYVENAKATPVIKNWIGTDIDGSNRLHLTLGEKDIDRVFGLYINGVGGQKLFTDYTVDVNKRFIQLTDSTYNSADDEYQLLYFADLPILQVNQVDYLDVTGLLDGDGKIKPELIGPLGSLTEAPDQVHNVAGQLTVNLAAQYQYRIAVSADITAFTLSSLYHPANFRLVINTTGSIAFTPAADWVADGHNYAADAKVLVGSRVYKCPAGQGHVSGASFSADLLAGKWKLHIRFDKDSVYAPSVDDEDILHVQCIGDDYFKITPGYGS